VKTTTKVKIKMQVYVSFRKTVLVMNAIQSHCCIFVILAPSTNCPYLLSLLLWLLICLLT